MQLLALAAGTLKDSHHPTKKAQNDRSLANNAWVGAWGNDDVTSSGFALSRPPRCVRTKGYFQELAYYMDYSEGDGRKSTRNSDYDNRINDDDHNGDFSWFPPVPSLMAAVAPPALHSVSTEQSTSSMRTSVPGDFDNALNAPLILHIRRCKKSRVSARTVFGNLSRGNSAPQLNALDRALSSGFYPALPLEYFSKAIREADAIAADGRSRQESESTAPAIRQEKPILIVTPDNCRRSPVVSSLLSAYPNRAQLASTAALAAVSSAPRLSSSRNIKRDPRPLSKQTIASSAATDFGLLRGGASNGGGLILSVGTFSFVAAWLALDDNYRRQERNSPHSELSTKRGGSSSAIRRRNINTFGPTSVHMPLAGCQRRFVPLQVPWEWLSNKGHHSSLSSRKSSSAIGVHNIADNASSSVFNTICRVEMIGGGSGNDNRRLPLREGIPVSAAVAVAARSGKKPSSRNGIVVLHRSRPYHRAVVDSSGTSLNINQSGNSGNEWSWICKEDNPMR